MKHIIKTFGLLMAVVMSTGAFAATSRASVRNQAASRLPSIAGHIVAGNVAGTTTTTTGSSTASYLDNSECIEKYTDCIKSSDACGADFEECTTNVLFHAQMPKCLSVLYQCQPSGVDALFGTSAINALSDVSSQNSNGEVTRYTYPKSGSVLDQLIIGAGISNQFSTEQCVRSYTRCLNREDICGSDFELCTSQKEFKKQAVLCASTLARCQSAGKIELFGSVANADSLRPSGADARLFTMIENGQQLAALNAVKTCQKVTDNCLINACTKNPLRCVEGTSMATISAADFVTGANELTGATSSTQSIGGTDYTDNYLESLTGSDIRKMLKAQCLETIGANKYCHMAYREKSPSNKDLIDIDLQEDVFALAYAARKDSVNTKIQESLKKFDTRAKDACYETIKSCTMRSCGGGLGSVCFRLARTGTTGVHVNNTSTYQDIQSGCAAIVNADSNCIYAATSGGTDGYQYAYTDASTFDTLFPEYTGSESDPIGAVGKLNALLATSYNDAAIENMRKQCQTVALSCVKSMCGKDYVNCYRNRTDIVSGTYDTGSGSFDRSMNKMGGVLDYNIVIGLCMNNVKSSSVCEEHLKVATAEWRNSQYTDGDSWGSNNSVRDAWLGANTTAIDTNAASNSVVIACRASQTTNAAGADCSGTMEPINGACSGVMDEDGCVYDTPVTQAMSEYALTNGAKTLFQTLLVDVEKEAQATYNAKLTKEQHVCLSNNHGGIIGATGDNGSTFMWAKLKGNKVPKNYQMKGLKTSDFTASNDLYGSFCRMRVTIQSDDKNIQDNLGSAATAYFAVGDTFTCGSWIDQKTLDKITEKVAEQARKEAGEGSSKAKWAQTLATVAPALAAGTGGWFLADAVQKNNGSLGGILSGTSKKTTEKHNKAAENCLTEIDKARKAYYDAANQTNTVAATYFRTALDHAIKARSYARSAGADVSQITKFDMVKYADPVTKTQTQTVSGVYKNETLSWDQDDVKNIRDIINKIRVATISGNTDACGDKCKDALKKAETIMDVAYTSTPTRENADNITKSVKNAWDACNKSSSGEDKGYCKDEVPQATIDAMKLDIKTTNEDKLLSTDAEFTYTIDGERVDKSEVYQKFPGYLNELETACQKVEDEAGHSKAGLNAAVAGGAAVVAGLSGFLITKGVQKVKYENAADEAVKAWMEEVGDHITCYVGTEEVGTYGDPIALEIN